MPNYDFWNTPEDYDGEPFRHFIVCNSGWEGCPTHHEYAQQVKECFEAKRNGDWPCSWLVRQLGEDGYYTIPCGRPTRYTDDRGSYECAAGHNHVPAEVMHERREAYASDGLEAKALAKAGMVPLTMDGQVYPL